APCPIYYQKQSSSRQGRPVRFMPKCPTDDRTPRSWVRKKTAQRNPQAIWTSGKSAKTCPALRAKIFRLTRRANQCSFFARLTADEGRIMIVTNARWDAVDAECAKDERALHVRRSRVVLAPRCWCQVL